MATATGDVPEEQLTCSICLEVFRSPATLPCAHTFCRGCIHNYWSKGDINCPLCLTRFHQRPALSVNLIMESLASGLRADEPPVAAAVALKHDDCHYRVMRRMAAAATHGDPQPDEDEGGMFGRLTLSPKQNKVMCPQHREHEMSLFCLQDNTLMCAKCAARHRAHKTVPAAQQIPQIKKMLQNEKIPATISTHNVKMDILKAQMNLEAFKESAKLQKEELVADFSRLINAIIDVKGRLTASMEEKEKRLLQKTESKVAMMEATSKSLEDNVSNIDAGLKSTDPFTVLQVYSSLQSSLNHASKMQCTDDSALDPEEKLTESRVIREQLITAVTAIWKDHGPVIPKAPAIDCTESRVSLSTLDKFKESLTFDPMTAGCYIWVSPEKKLARSTYPFSQTGEVNTERSEGSQVRASQSFTGGRHFWRVQCPNLPAQFGIESNSKSWPSNWCVEIQNNNIVVKSAEKSFKMQTFQRYTNFGIYLDYDSGILSIYGLHNSASLLYSFTTSFGKLVLYPLFEVKENTHVLLS